MNTVLVTGGTGVVGSALLPKLADFQLLGLVYRSALNGAVADHVRGDLSRPRLGLDARAFRELARRTDAIVHCAAEVDFTAGREVAQSVNVAGTENVLDLASLAEAPVYYVSTAFVARAGTLREADEGPAVYIDSKRAAEQRVRDSGLPAVLIRPSVVSGDSATGQIARFQGLHVLAGAILRGFLPLLPLPAEARIDFLPQDVVADCIAEIVRREEREGEYWLTAGSDAVEARRIVELCGDVGRELGREVAEPRLVDPELVDRLIRPVFIETLPEQAQRHFDQMLQTTALFYTDEPFPSSLADLGHDASRTGLEGAFSRSMRYWAETKGLAEPLPLAA